MFEIFSNIPTYCSYYYDDDYDKIFNILPGRISFNNFLSYFLDRILKNYGSV